MPSSHLTIVHRPSRVPGRAQRLGSYAIEALLTPSEEGAGTVYRVALEGGTTTAASVHRLAEEYYYVLSGAGSVALDGDRHDLVTGDFLRLPPGTVHQFTASGEGLELLNIHTPGCWPDRDTYFIGDAPAGFAP